MLFTQQHAAAATPDRTSQRLCLSFRTAYPYKHPVTSRGWAAQGPPNRHNRPGAAAATMTATATTPDHRSQSSHSAWSAIRRARHQLRGSCRVLHPHHPIASTCPTRQANTPVCSPATGPVMGGINRSDQPLASVYYTLGSFPFPSCRSGAGDQGSLPGCHSKRELR